jgi:hypothetical protein
MMSTTETREHNRYTRQDFVCDACFLVVLIAGACGLLELTGSWG